GERGGVVDVLLVGPHAVAGVVEDRDVGLLVDAAVAGVVHAVLHLAHDPTAILVDDVPVDGELVHAIARERVHRRRDPGPDRLPPLEAAVVVLDVGGVLGELVGPGAPVAGGAGGGGGPLVGGERLLQLPPRELSHGGTI